MTDDLTAPQLDALRVLALQTKPIGAHRRRTQSLPIPRVNIKAVGHLVDRKLVSLHFPSWLGSGVPGLRPTSSVFTHDYTYTITDAGRQHLERIAAG